MHHLGKKSDKQSHKFSSFAFVLAEVVQFHSLLHLSQMQQERGWAICDGQLIQWLSILVMKIEMLYDHWYTKANCYYRLSHQKQWLLPIHWPLETGQGTGRASQSHSSHEWISHRTLTIPRYVDQSRINVRVQRTVLTLINCDLMTLLKLS